MIRRFVLVALLVFPHAAAAQDTLAHSLIPRTHAVLLLAGVGALMPFDARISHTFDASGLQHNGTLHSGASVFNELGDPGTAMIAAAMLGAGLVAHSENLTDVGLHSSEAIALSGTVTWLLKGMAGRLRPNASPGDADEFKFAGGFSGAGGQSFPSGHTTAAFALATTLSDEVRLRNPSAARFVTPISYTAASAVGLARMYSQKHWASDVLLGAAVGYYSSKFIFRRFHTSKR